MSTEKTLYVIIGILSLLFGITSLCFGIIFNGVILILLGVFLIWISSTIKRVDNTMHESKLNPEDILKGNGREILQMHWNKYEQCKNKHESLMTCMWTKSNEDSAWQLLSGWHEGQVCTFYLWFNEDEERLKRFRSHRYYSLFTGDDGGVKSDAMELEFDVLDDRAIEIFTAILAEIFEQKGNNVKAYFG